MIWGGLPNYATDVENLINAVNNNFIPKDGSDVEFIDQRKQALIDLRDLLVASELSFFSQLNITKKSPKECLEQLQKRIIEIEEKNKEFSIDALEQKFLNDPTIIAMLDKITTNAVNAALSSIDWTFEDLVGRPENEFIDYIIDNFSNRIMKRSLETGRMNNYFANIDKQGLKRILKITRSTTKDNYFHIEIKADESVSIELRNKLLEVIRDETHTKQANTSTEFKQKVIKSLLAYITSTSNNELARYLYHELDVNFDRYDLTRNLSSLKGFLQESWTNALLSYLFGQPGESIPTGNLQNLLDNKAEIPVDAVLRTFNFQIKSWNLINGKYEINESNKEIGTFIKQRAQITSTDLLMLFFSSYQFNQPFSDAIPENPNSMTHKEYSENIYSRFNPTAMKLEPVFQSYVDKIVRIDNVFRGYADDNQGGGFLFGKEQLYFNTFFIINDKIIPASAMIQAIIDTLNQKTDSDVLKFQINSISETRNVNTFEDIIIANQRKKRYSEDYEKVANLVKISYTITFDFNEILNNAYKWF